MINSFWGSFSNVFLFQRWMVPDNPWLSQNIIDRNSQLHWTSSPSKPSPLKQSAVFSPSAVFRPSLPVSHKFEVRACHLVLFNHIQWVELFLVDVYERARGIFSASSLLVTNTEPLLDSYAHSYMRRLSRKTAYPRCSQSQPVQNVSLATADEVPTVHFKSFHAPSSFPGARPFFQMQPLPPQTSSFLIHSPHKHFSSIHPETLPRSFNKQSAPSTTTASSSMSLLLSGPFKADFPRLSEVYSFSM